MPTHAQVLRGTGGTTADTFALVGTNITLPAGGPWTIFAIWMLVAQATAVLDESLDGAMRLNALSGDLSPDPAPGIYPVVGVNSPASANYGACSMPLNLWKVNWQAAGKSVLTIEHKNWNVLAVAPRVACGIIFGDTVPENKPLVFCDAVQADSTGATEANLGTITIAEKASRIVGVMGTIFDTGASTADDPCIGTFRLTSDDVGLAPAEFPFCQAIQPMDGTEVGPASAPQAQFIPVDIPVAGGSRIDCFGISSVAVANGASMAVFIAYE